MGAGPPTSRCACPYHNRKKLTSARESVDICFYRSIVGKAVVASIEKVGCLRGNLRTAYVVRAKGIQGAACGREQSVYLLRSGIARLAAFSTISAVTFRSPRAHFSLHSRICLMVMSNSFWR